MGVQITAPGGRAQNQGGHVRPDECGCGEQCDFWFSPSAVGELYANMEAVSRRSYGSEAMCG